MKYNYTGRNIDLSDSLKEYIEKKLSRIGKYFTEEVDVYVTLSVQKSIQKIEVTIPVKGSVIRCEKTGNDLYAAIDELQDVLERQIRRNRKKTIERYQDKKSISDFFDTSFEVPEDGEEESIKIVKSKRFAIKPMTPEDACFEMDMIGHSFYVFYNAETDLVSVVYKRKDGNYGLIEPEY